MNWVEIVGVAGLVATLVGVFLAWGPWKDHRIKRKRDDLNELAQAVVKGYKAESIARYPYAEVKGSIPLTCVINNEVRSRGLVSELARMPLPGQELKPALVIGEYGQGKTIACGALAYELAQAFLRDPASGRLPILISLREYSDLRSLDQVALASVRRLHNLDLDAGVYSRARASGQLVFILDGLDELLSRADSGTVREHLDILRNDAAFLQNRLVVTTRPNVFDVIDVAYLRSGFDWITIQLPTLKQVYDYLSARGLLRFVETLQEADAGLLRGLIRRPLFLDMIAASAASLPSIQSAQDITESRIYDQYFNAWYLRELPKMGPTIRTLKLDQVDRILSNVAYFMTEQNSTFVTENDFVAIVQREGQANPRQDLDTLGRQATNRLLLVPEFSSKARRFTFRHDSLRSYFCARYLFHRFVDDPGGFEALAKFDSVSLLFFLANVKAEQSAYSVISELHRSDLSQTNYRKNILGVIILYWAIANKSVDLHYLRDFCSQASPAVRALLLSNLGNMDLSGFDFSGLNLSNAGLRNSKLVGTILKSADLSNAVLDGAKLTRAKLEGTALTGASFRLADLSETSLIDVVESGADFERTSFQKVVALRCHFSKSRFTSADLTEASLRDCVFEESPFISATFDNSRIESCRWRSCDVNGASFRGAMLTSSEFDDTNTGDAVGLPHTGWTDGRVV